mmetsp:Transcript_17800/g.17029  ORF Transcript_17800/g.17029 Transcript_17800/m.17029 type:complete len:84 (+) Transcript_17800:466-717(+)
MQAAKEQLNHQGITSKDLENTLSESKLKKRQEQFESIKRPMTQQIGQRKFIKHSTIDQNQSVDDKFQDASTRFDSNFKFDQSI